MGLLDKVKAQAEQAAAKAKEGVQDVQLKRELGQVHEELGKLAFELVDKGELTHERLTPLVDKVRGLHARLEENGPAEPAAEAPPAQSGPPAMPS